MALTERRTTFSRQEEVEEGGLLLPFSVSGDPGDCEEGRRRGERARESLRARLRRTNAPTIPAMIYWYAREKSVRDGEDGSGFGDEG